MAYDKSIVITRELNRSDRLQDLDEHLDEDLDDVETIFLPHVITTSSLYLSHTDYSLFCFLFYLFYKLQSFALSDLSYFSCVFFKSMFSVTWIQIWVALVYQVWPDVEMILKSLAIFLRVYLVLVKIFNLQMAFFIIC